MICDDSHTDRFSLYMSIPVMTMGLLTNVALSAVGDAAR